MGGGKQAHVFKEEAERAQVLSGSAESQVKVIQRPALSPGSPMTSPRVVAGSQRPLLLLLLAGVCSDCFKPVIIVHGVFDGPQQFGKLSEFIEEV